MTILSSARARTCLKYHKEFGNGLRTFKIWLGNNIRTFGGVLSKVYDVIRKIKTKPRLNFEVVFLLEFWINVKSVTNLKSFFFYNMSSSEKKFELKRFCFFFLFCFFRLFLKSVCFRKVGTWKKGFEKQKDCFIFKTQAPFFSKARGTSTPLPPSAPVPFRCPALSKKSAWVLKIKQSFCFSKPFFQVPTFRKKTF